MRQIFSILLFLLICYPALANGQLSVHFIDVGHGDSILVQSPSGKTMLIDTGGNDRKCEQYLASLGVRRLDVIVGTHPHLDHIGSMPRIVKDYEIGNIIMPRVSANTKTFQSLLQNIQAKEMKINTAKAGMIIPFDDAIQIECLAPNSDQYDDLNDYSIVLKLTYGDVSFLFTGDAAKVSEKEMVQLHRGKLKSTVMKVPHHGSTSSGSQAFVDAVSPQAVVYMIGVNDYGHPTQTILKRLAHCANFRTDEQGTIILTTDGRQTHASISKQSSNQEVAAQTSAKTASETDTTENVVYVTRSGVKYHQQGCRHAANATAIPLNEAIKNYTPCAVCNRNIK